MENEQTEKSFLLDNAEHKRDRKDSSTMTVPLKSSLKKTKKNPKKNLKDHENLDDTNESNWKTKIQIIIFVIFACFLSITVASKIRFTPVISHSLTDHFKNKFAEEQMEWIGRLYAIIVLCLLPIVCAVIDNLMISYRTCLIFSGLLHIIACITNSTVTHPLFFVLTDSFVCGLGSAVAFSVFLLAIDDIFPKGNRYRIMATTFCQGSTIGSLFVLEIYAWCAKYWGWVHFQLLLAGIFGCIAVVLILVCPEEGFHITVMNRISPLKNPMKHPLSPPNKVLGLTFEEMNNSPSVFAWLCYRFILSIIHQGLFLLMIQDTRVIIMPDFDSLLKNYYTSTLALIAFSCGESVTYIVGAIVGVFLLGYLLHISIVFLCFFFLLLVVWQPVRSKALNNASYMMIGHVISGGLTGCCVGALNTCLIATSEEATMISGRRIFPFVKLLEGMSIALSPFVFTILNKVSDMNIWLLTFAILTAACACLLVYILHKLYMKYMSNTSDRRISMQVSMKPANFLNRAFDSS